MLSERVALQFHQWYRQSTFSLLEKNGHAARNASNVIMLIWPQSLVSIDKYDVLKSFHSFYSNDSNEASEVLFLIHRNVSNETKQTNQTIGQTIQTLCETCALHFDPFPENLP